jgi:5-methylcytosine-specific restriction endonuclease McrBC regulatory subunit McrC
MIAKYINDKDSGQSNEKNIRYNNIFQYLSYLSAFQLGPRLPDLILFRMENYKTFLGSIYLDFHLSQGRIL